MLGAQALIKTGIPKRQIWKERSAVVGTNGKEAVLSSPHSFHLKRGLRGWEGCKSFFISVTLEDGRNTATGSLNQRRLHAAPDACDDVKNTQIFHLREEHITFNLILTI